MSLWVDKYRPKELDNLDYHQDLSKSIRSLAASGDFPHLLMYGPSGAGKKTRVMATLRELYGPGVEKLKIDARIVQTSSSRKTEFTVVSSAYHLEITPSDMGNQDRVIIQDLLKEIGQTQQVDASAKQRFKVVVINEADSLTRDAQSALRRTMEKYSPNLRLILLANSTSNIMAPIRSRTLLIRCAAPNNNEIATVLGKIAINENIEINEQDQVFENIANASGRNLRKAILMLEAMYVNNTTIDSSTKVPPADWEKVLDEIAKQITKSQSPESLLTCRKKYYDLLSHCIPAGVIIKHLTFMIMDKAGEKVTPQVAERAAFYEHRIRLGNKAIFHLEAFTARVMRDIQEAK